MERAIDYRELIENDGWGDFAYISITDHVEAKSDEDRRALTVAIQDPATGKEIELKGDATALSDLRDFLNFALARLAKDPFHKNLLGPADK